jgi:hypothetical protein
VSLPWHHLLSPMVASRSMKSAPCLTESAGLICGPITYSPCTWPRTAHSSLIAAKALDIPTPSHTAYTLKDCSAAHRFFWLLQL